MAANAVPTAEQKTMEELFGERDEAASLLVECLKTLDRAMGAYRVVNQSAYRKWSAYIHHEVAIADELDPSKVVPFKAFQWPLKVDSMGDLRTRILHVTLADDDTPYSDELRDAIKSRRRNKANAEAERVEA